MPLHCCSPRLHTRVPPSAANTNTRFQTSPPRPDPVTRRGRGPSRLRDAAMLDQGRGNTFLPSPRCSGAPSRPSAALSPFLLPQEGRGHLPVPPAPPHSGLNDADGLSASGSRPCPGARRRPPPPPPAVPGGPGAAPGGSGPGGGGARERRHQRHPSPSRPSARTNLRPPLPLAPGRPDRGRPRGSGGGGRGCGGGSRLSPGLRRRRRPLGAQALLPLPPPPTSSSPSPSSPARRYGAPRPPRLRMRGARRGGAAGPAPGFLSLLPPASAPCPRAPAAAPPAGRGGAPRPLPEQRPQSRGIQRLGRDAGTSGGDRQRSRAPSAVQSDTSRDGDSATALGSPPQSLIAPSVKKFLLMSN
uniref:proline-rich protein HaeIII subfamily 1-like n=1 Tax=Lonchura striata TaxID=40157 RepID=UPI000B4DD1AD|nr:proline-rich protein HaeIII subfamily 1-like [Lonchura striata domestica]